MVNFIIFIKSEHAQNINMATTIHGVAKKADVSISTVSRVLNNSSYVSGATREKVNAAMEELGYRQNRIAHSLRSRESNYIGLIVPDVANEFFASLASTIEKTIRQQGYSLFLCNSTENQEIENRYIESLMGNQVRGIIIVSAGDPPEDELRNADIPIVLIDRLSHDPDQTGCVMIESDNRKGGEIAAEAFLRRGARRFLFMGDHRNMRAMRRRRIGFSETLFQNGTAGSDYHEILLPISAAAARETVRQIWTRSSFDAVFCGTDLLAIGAIKGFNDIGVRVPDDVQIIGFDGIELGELTVPSLSTVRQDIPQMGRIAGESMIRMIAGDQINRKTILPVEFVERGSTR